MFARLQCAKMFVDAGADLKVKDSQGTMPYEMLEDEEFQQLRKALTPN